MSSDKVDFKKRSKEIFTTIKQTPFYYGPLGIIRGIRIII